LLAPRQRLGVVEHESLGVVQAAAKAGLQRGDLNFGFFLKYINDILCAEFFFTYLKIVNFSAI
jgi:hypothetical protein